MGMFLLVDTHNMRPKYNSITSRARPYDGRATVSFCKTIITKSISWKGCHLILVHIPHTLPMGSETAVERGWLGEREEENMRRF